MPSQAASDGREGAEPHQGGGDGRACGGGQFAQRRACLGAGIDHAAADIEQWPSRVGDQRHRLADARGVSVQLGRIGVAEADLAGALIAAGGELHVLGNVDQHRPRAAALGDVEGLVQGAGQVGHVAHQDVVLGGRSGDADGVALLEGVGADQVGGHLAGEDHERHRVHQRIDDAGHRIGGPGAGSDEHHARLARGPRIALGRMHRALLVAHEHVAQPRLMVQRVVDRQDRAAGIAEQRLDALIDQRPHDDLRAGHRGGGGGGVRDDGGVHRGRTGWWEVRGFG